MCWHKWGKWEQYLWIGKIRKPGDDRVYPAEIRRQKRKCIKCSKAQDERY